mgnify:CR=1 FL=1
MDNKENILISCKNVSMNYDRRLAVDDVSFEITPISLSEILGLFFLYASYDELCNAGAYSFPIIPLTTALIKSLSIKCFIFNCII